MKIHIIPLHFQSQSSTSHLLLLLHYLTFVYRIRNCIDTHHQVEVDATLYVMDKLCAVSPVFANGILPKIASLLDSLSTSPKRKIHFIKIMRHMHHTTDILLPSFLLSILSFDLVHLILPSFPSSYSTISTMSLCLFYYA